MGYLPLSMKSASPSFAFFGTPAVARDTLAALIEGGYLPSVVVTSPDARRGRGMKKQPSETRAYAEDYGMPVLASEVLDNQFLKDLELFGCHYAIVVAYGRILPQPVLDLFPGGLLNVHYSLLPRYRGAAPVERALLAGESETGVSIQKMVLKMDAGDVLAQEHTPIEATETIGELRHRLIKMGADLLIASLPAFLDNGISATPQEELKITFAPKIEKSEGQLSLHDSPEQNWRTYRALIESLGVYFYAHKEGKRIRVKVKKAHREGDAFVIDRIVPEGKSERPFLWLADAGWEPE